jgi:hypothetical protein
MHDVHRPHRALQMCYIDGAMRKPFAKFSTTSDCFALRHAALKLFGHAVLSHAQTCKALGGRSLIFVSRPVLADFVL